MRRWWRWLVRNLTMRLRLNILLYLRALGDVREAVAQGEVECLLTAGRGAGRVRHRSGASRRRMSTAVASRHGWASSCDGGKAQEGGGSDCAVHYVMKRFVVLSE